MILLKSVYFVRSKKVLLHNINWEIKEGENWILFGKNGSGKTLLLSLITGYLYPSRGEIFRFGKLPYEYDLRELRRTIGYVGTPLRNMFDSFSSISIIDVVLSGYFATIGLYSTVTKEMNKTALASIDRIGMLKRANEAFGYLSDGEKQKLLIMRAIINRPKILVLDEPAMGLDIPSRENLLSLIRDLTNEERISIIYTTHQTEEVIDIFDKILILDSGRVFFKGRVEDGLTSENISKLFEREVKIISHNKRYFTLIGGDNARK